MARLAILPEAYLSHAEVGADEIAVLAALSLHTNKTGTCFPSQGLLARLLNRSRPWVNKVISRLVDLGLIERTHQSRHDGGERACLYRLIGLPLESKSPSPALSETSSSSDSDRASQQIDTACHADDSIKIEQENQTGTHTASDSIISNDGSEVLPPGIPGALPLQMTIEPAKPAIPSLDWVPSDADLIYVLERFPTIQPDTLTEMNERFLLRCQAKGYKYLDISSGWRAWLADDLRKANESGQRGSSRGSSAQAKFDVWATVAGQASRESMRGYNA